ncbi:MAG: serine hydrolase [Bacteroidales bacterium]
MKNLLIAVFVVTALLISIPLLSQKRDYWPHDGWKTKLPEEVGMDTLKLINMKSTIQSSMKYVDAFLIVKDGYLVFENYYNGYNDSTFHHLWSSTKSVTNIMMGIMFKKKYVDDVNLRVIDFFPEYDTINSDRRIEDITLEHLMAFTAGLNSRDAEAYASSSIDALKYYFGNTFISNPGAQFKYATPASHFQSALITKILGITEKELAEQELFPKLGIDNYNWITDESGYSYGGHNSYFCPRDMLKFGYLYLNQGIWNGDTIVDPEFVKTSTSIHTNGGTPHNEKYGYNWWITTNNGYNAYFAGGFGGQFIYVVPDLDLVVAITCNSNSHRENARFLINTHVVPSIIQQSTSIQYLKKNENLEIQVFPNPVKDNVKVNFNIERKVSVNLNLTDLFGRKVLNLLNNEIFEAGNYTLGFDLNLSSGLYFINGQIGEAFIRKNLIIIK